MMTGPEIRALRLSLNMQPTQFARLLGLKGKHARRDVIRWEKGTRPPSDNLLTIMARLARNEAFKQAQKALK
jgi:DNA-binding transcriptional regulator YiaG